MKLFLTLLIFFVGSCAKERSCENCVDNSYKKATIVFGGPVATDGCGWLIKIGAHTFHPDVLDVALQQDGLLINISYELTSDKFVCGISALQIPVIHVIDIRR